MFVLSLKFTTINVTHPEHNAKQFAYKYTISNVSYQSDFKVKPQSVLPILRSVNSVNKVTNFVVEMNKECSWLMTCSGDSQPNECVWAWFVSLFDYLRLYYGNREIVDGFKHCELIRTLLLFYKIYIRLVSLDQTICMDVY